MSKQNRFHTRQPGNEGARVALYDPVTGEDTGDWITIRSTDSDAYHLANTKAMRSLPEIQAMKDEEARVAAVRDVSFDIVTALVADWSFDEPCTTENVKQFLQEAPQIKATIDKLAGDRALFIKSSSQPSDAGQSMTSDSAPVLEEAPQP
jgi:hypothetical protein